MTKTTYKALQFFDGLLDRLEEFDGNSMYGRKGRPLTTGRLSDTERAQLDRDRVNGITYHVRSYTTPIAWVRWDGSVYVTEQKFSPTTSRGQQLCRTWLNRTERDR